MYSRGVSQRIPSTLMMSRCPCGICLHSFILVSQSATSLPASQSALSLPSQLISIPFLIGAMPPTDCINCGTCRAPFILTLTSRKTTSTTLNHSLHPRATLTTPSYSLHQRVTHEIARNIIPQFFPHPILALKALLIVGKKFTKIFTLNVI